MRIRKILSLAVISVIVSAGIASALSLGDFLPSSERTAEKFIPENALSIRPEDSVYFVLKLDDTSSFLKWLASDDNINVFMPLILKSEDSNDIIGGIEFFRAFATKTPIKSAALILGCYNPDTKKDSFFQMAFTVDPSMAETVKKIAEGKAEDSDFAKLFLGNNNPITAIAESMIKAEKLNDGSYRVDNELFLKADAGSGLIMLGDSENDLKDSLLAIESDDARLFGHVKRKFTEKDFAFVHVDYKTLDKVDTDHSLDDADEIADEFFDKPINVELAFESLPDKFILSLAANFREAMTKEYADAMSNPVTPVKGAYLSLCGTKSPLLAFGGFMNLSPLKDRKDTKDAWKEVVRQMRVRFGIIEEEIISFFNGPFSLTVNDNVTYESFKIPALYISQTGTNGSAGKIFERLTKSPHFQKIQDGILQLDSSLSPVSALIQDKGETLGINFAELASLNGTPKVKPALQSLLEAEGISAVWIDFDEIRSWLMDDENGVMAMALPMAKMFGYGEIADSVMDVLTAEFSVPSVSFRAESPERFRFEFANAKINPENGLFARLVKVYQRFSK